MCFIALLLIACITQAEESRPSGKHLVTYTTRGGVEGQVNCRPVASLSVQ